MRYPELQAREIETAPRYGEKPDYYPKGRRCSVPGCNHLLSRWNPGPNCHSCGATDEEQEEALQQLIARAPGPQRAWDEALATKARRR